MSLDSNRESSRLDDVLRPEPWDTLQAADEATRDRWTMHAYAELWAAVALYVGLDPDSIESCGESAIRTMDACRRESELNLAAPFDQYLVALDVAVGALAAGRFAALVEAEDPRRSVVVYDALNEWARGAISVIRGWPPAGELAVVRRGAVKGLDEDATSVLSAKLDADKRPFERSILRQMLDWATDFRADAATRGEMVTNAALAEYLKAKFPGASIGSREAVAIDTRLRHQRKGRPPGR